MKLMLALTGITLAVCSPAPAQEASERVVVPARNSTRPRKVDVSLFHGAVTIKAYNGKDVIVETGEPVRTPARTEGGMHRIDTPLRGVNVEEEDNVITIRPSTVPALRLANTVLMSSRRAWWMCARTLPSAANATASAAERTVAGAGLSRL